MIAMAKSRIAEGFSVRFPEAVDAAKLPMAWEKQRHDIRRVSGFIDVFSYLP